MMEQYRAVYSLFKRYCAYGDIAVQTRESLSSSARSNIACVPKASIGICTEDARRILSYLPALRRNRKTIQYLTVEETCSVRDVLFQEDSLPSLRDRATGMLLYFTGMRFRATSLCFSDINWKKDEIRMTQRKTRNAWPF